MGLSVSTSQDSARALANKAHFRNKSSKKLSIFRSSSLGVTPLRCPHSPHPGGTASVALTTFPPHGTNKKKTKTQKLFQGEESQFSSSPQHQTSQISNATRPQTRNVSSVEKTADQTGDNMSEDISDFLQPYILGEFGFSLCTTQLC